MNNSIYLVVTTKILESCDCDPGAVIYSLLPTVMNFSEKNDGNNKVHGLALANHPKILSSALNILGDGNSNSNSSNNVTKSSAIYQKIKEEKDNILNSLIKARQFSELPNHISDNKIAAALSLVSCCYLNSLFYPTQSFLPNSSSCSGQWEFWEKVNYLDLLQRMKNKDFFLNFKDEISKNTIWKAKFKPEDFPEMIRKRLHKEDAFNKKLSAESLIKAMIIRMGEMAQPKINYEIIDYTIRSFFTYLGVKQYLRVDRETKFLRGLEKEIIQILT
jgi:hypothetical protein